MIIMKRIFVEMGWDGVDSKDVAQGGERCYAVFEKRNINHQISSN